MKSAPSGYFVLLSLLFDLAASKLFISLPEAHKYEGENFFVLCRDPDEGAQVQWRNPKNRVINNKSGNVQKTDTNHGSQLTFKHIRKEDEGTYTCRSTKGNKEQVEFQLFVFERQPEDDIPEFPPLPTTKPKINRAPSSASTLITTTPDPISFPDTPTQVKGKEGTDIMMKCEAKNAEPEVLVDGTKPTNGSKYKVLADGLLILNATPEDSKHQYICQAINLEKGAYKTLDITLTVHHPPRPKNRNYEQHNIVYGYLGGTVNLTCAVEAEPEPKLKWFRNDRRKIIGQKVPLSDPRVSVISVFLESVTDFGEYKCEATNSEGKNVTSFTLEMGSRAEPPELVEILEANATSMSIYIEPPNATQEELVEPYLEPTGFLVEYRPLEEPVWNAQTFPQIAEDKTYVLSNLTKNTTYQVRVATLNLAGSSEFTNGTQYTTASAAVNFNVPGIIRNIFSLAVLLLFKTVT